MAALTLRHTARRWLRKPGWRQDMVAKDNRLTEIVLRDMEREWRQLYARYSHFQEFTELVQKTMGGKKKKAA